MVKRRAAAKTTPKKKEQLDVSNIEKDYITQVRISLNYSEL